MELLELRAQPDLEHDTGLAVLLGSSLSSLHAKTFAIDKKRIFIGSFNFDPRSAALNTEMGLLIDSTGMAERLSAALDQRNFVYQVQLERDGELAWVQSATDGAETIYSTEPNTTLVQRLLARIISFLPVEWML